MQLQEVVQCEPQVRCKNNIQKTGALKISKCIFGAKSKSTEDDAGTAILNVATTF
jgi:hypothetical protein